MVVAARCSGLLGGELQTKPKMTARRMMQSSPSRKVLASIVRCFFNPPMFGKIDVYTVIGWLVAILQFSAMDSSMISNYADLACRPGHAHFTSQESM